MQDFGRESFGQRLCGIRNTMNHVVTFAELISYLVVYRGHHE